MLFVIRLDIEANLIINKIMVCHSKKWGSINLLIYLSKMTILIYLHIS